MENMTPEEIAAEKARQLKIQEDSDLEMAKLTFGGKWMNHSSPLLEADHIQQVVFQASSQV